MANEIERKYMAHFINTNINGESWYRIGKDLSEYEIELNPSFEIERDMLGNEYINYENYEPSAEADIFYARENDALSTLLQGIADGLKVGSNCTTYAMEVHMWGEAYTGVTYTETPIGINPKQRKWYELSGGVYVLTTDTSVVANKSYYILNFPAVRRQCYLVPTSIGGDTSGYQIPFQVTYFNDPTAGYYLPNEGRFATEI